MPSSKTKRPSFNEESKAIATLTTILSALIYRLPNGLPKDLLLIAIGIVGYSLYHTGILVKNFVCNEVASWTSLAIAEFKVKRYVRELDEARKKPGISPERIIEIDSESKNYRETLAKKRMENLK